MNQIYKEAGAAMAAAYSLSKLRHRIVYRHICQDSWGNNVWLVSLQSDPDIAIQEFSTRLQ